MSNVPPNFAANTDGPSQQDNKTQIAADLITRWRSVASGIGNAGAAVPVASVALALLLGAVLIAATDTETQRAAAYFLGRPADLVSAVIRSVSGAYTSLFQGAIYDLSQQEFANQIKPLAATLTFATPLVAAGLGVGLAFRAGLFNIGGQGQMLVAAACAGWVGFSMQLPAGFHMLLAMIAGLMAASLWAGLAGFLKARTGAHEVIVTIMLNYVAFYLIAFLLRTPVLQAPGSTSPKTAPIADTAAFYNILGPGNSLHIGFVLAVGATILTSWFLKRSGPGFELRAVGLNPRAARVAGINVKNIYLQAMVLSGALVGLAGVSQALGSVKTGFGTGIDAGIGFDAITVALLGRSKPWGIFAAGILFGALKAGGFSMQASQGIPIDIVLVLQSLIVLFVAAPPLLRSLLALPRKLGRSKRDLTRTKSPQRTAAAR